MRVRIIAMQAAAAVVLAGFAVLGSGCCGPVCAGLDADQCRSVPGCAVRRSHTADPKGGHEIVDCVAND